MEIRKKILRRKLDNLESAIKDIKNVSVNIAFESIERLMLNFDKSKLDKIYTQSIEEQS